MKRVVAFWVVAAGVAFAATITAVERSGDDREAVVVDERTASAEPPGARDLTLVTGTEDDAGGADDVSVSKRTERSDSKRSKRRGAVVTAATGGATTATTTATTSRAKAVDAAEPQATARSSSETSAPAAPAAAPTSWRQAPAADASQCPSSRKGIVVDRQWQRAWLCRDGAVVSVFPITSASNQPDPGTYPIYALDYQTSSNFGDAPSTLDRFVAFTYGKFKGARIGFHAVPYYADGSHAQPLESVGELARLGESSGCIRVLPDDAELIYSTMRVGDEVRVIS